MGKIKKSIIVFLEIATLIVGLFAFAYLIGESYSVRGFEIKEDDFSKGVSLVFVSLIKSLDLIPSVSAQETSVTQCCPLTKSGATCQDVLSSQVEEVCDASVSASSTSCEFDSRCRVGCCIDDNYGTCTPQSTAGACSGENVRFVGDKASDASCLDLNLEDNACVQGCCLLGDQAIFTTRGACNYQAGDRYGEDPFNPAIKTEFACLALAATDEKGACVFDNEDGTRGCRFISEKDCVQNQGVHHSGLLCTDETLNTICEPIEQTTCVEGRDEIYFMDSCGNVANIYDASKVNDQTYWNSVVNKDNSCGIDSVDGNVGSSSCGNCNRFLGSSCGNVGGENVCVDLNCEASEATGGVDRLSGESWCVYDGAIGEGKDTPGSRHFKRICINGEVKVETCADYRGQICVQNDVVAENGDSFSVASCKVNEAIQCLNYNSLGNEDSNEEVLDACNENEDCYVKNVNVDDGFKFDICLPNYPRGFDLSSDSITASDELCKAGSQSCTVVYQKKLTGGWKCVHNCDCESAEFADEMNDVCMSFGDCGASVNYVGELSENYQVLGSSRLSPNYLSEISDYSEVVKGQYARTESISEILAQFGEPSVYQSGDEIELEDSQYLEMIKLTGTVAGASGLLIKGLGFIGVIGGSGGNVIGGTATSLGAIESAGSLSYATTPIPASAIEGASVGTSASFAGFGAALGGISIGITVGSFIANAFGLQGDAVFAVAAASGIAGGIAGYAAVQGSSIATIGLGGSGGVGILGATLAAFAWALIVAVILSLIFKFILGIGETKEKIVEFNCLPWEAPVGGNNCEECNDDDLFPCTEYRCDSLGQACQFINSDSRFERCEAVNRDDNSPPQISAGDIAQNFTFENEVFNERVDLRQDNGDCIPEFTPVGFVLETDEVAQCKVSFDSNLDYEEMDFNSVDGSLYLFNHTFNFMVPSLDSLDVRDLSGDVIERFGRDEMFVVCQDVQGNQNTRAYRVNFCVEEGPDLTAPRVLSSVPINGAYLREGMNETILTLNINEPAECRYDSSNKDFEEMENEMICANYVDGYSSVGWPCRTTLENLERGENNFWFKCKDQPWIEDENYEGNLDGSARNTNNGHEYVLTVTEEPLSIDSIEPSGNITRGFSPIVLIDVSLKTSGGIENGVSSCYLSQTGYESGMVLLRHTFSKTHTQPSLQYTQGKHKIYFRCEDDVGNVALAETEFNVEIDNEPPMVVRVLHQDGLKLITNEEASCYYSKSSCDFALTNGTSMTNVLDTIHKAPWNTESTYYVKCVDLYGNENGDCAIQVSPAR